MHPPELAASIWTVHYLPGTHPAGGGSARDPETVHATDCGAPQGRTGWVVFGIGGEPVKMVPAELVAVIDRPIGAPPGLPEGFGDELPEDGTLPWSGVHTCPEDCREHRLHMPSPAGLLPVVPPPANRADATGAVAFGTTRPDGDPRSEPECPE